MEEMPAIPLVYEAGKQAKDSCIVSEVRVPATIIDVKRLKWVRTP